MDLVAACFRLRGMGYDYSVDGVRVPCPLLVYRAMPDLLSFISEDPRSAMFSELRHRTHFQAWALGESDKHEEDDDPKYWTLDSLMKLNGACPRSHTPIQPVFDASENRFHIPHR